MKIFVSYRFTGMEKDELKTNLELLATTLEKQNHNVFIFSRDVQKWWQDPHPLDLSQVMPSAFKEIQKRDCVVVFLYTCGSSTGMGLEVGYAKALGKKIVLLIKKDCQDDYIESIADKVIRFKDFDALKDIVL